MPVHNQQIDWTRIADCLQRVMGTMLHDEGRHHDATFYADALQRTFGYVAAGEPGIAGRSLPYDRLEHGQGLTTDSATTHLLDSHSISDRMGRERAEEQVKEVREEMRRVYREAGKDFADLLRARCNERSVPSRYRREGVQWAADLIDPTVPKDPYGNVREATPASAS